MNNLKYTSLWCALYLLRFHMKKKNSHKNNQTSLRIVKQSVYIFFLNLNFIPFSYAPISCLHSFTQHTNKMNESKCLAPSLFAWKSVMFHTFSSLFSALYLSLAMNAICLDGWMGIVCSQWYVSNLYTRSLTSTEIDERWDSRRKWFD